MSVPFHCHILQCCSYRCFVDKCSTQAVNVVVDAVYSPYVPYLLDYPTLQQTFLTEQLQATRLVGITHGIYNTTWQPIIRSHRGSVHLHSLICQSVTWDILGQWWLAVVTLIILTVTWWGDDVTVMRMMMMMMMLMMAIYLGINEFSICFSTCLTKTSFHRSSPVTRGCPIFSAQTQYFQY